VRSVVDDGRGAGTGVGAVPLGAGAGVVVAGGAPGVGEVAVAAGVVLGDEPPLSLTRRTTAMPSATAATTSRARVARGERQNRARALSAGGRRSGGAPGRCNPVAGGVACGEGEVRGAGAAPAVGPGPTGGRSPVGGCAAVSPVAPDGGGDGAGGRTESG
jgi:hypothetical protein